MKVALDLYGARFRAPYGFGSRTISRTEGLLLSLCDGQGHVGCGEAVALPGYHPVILSEVRAAIEDCLPLLQGADGGDDHSRLLAECARVAVLPEAVAAIDLALWDLAGRRAGLPVWRLLGASSAPAVAVNATIAARDRAAAAHAAAAALRAGYRCVKVKVGLGDDAGRLAAVRAAAGLEMAIRIDANGVWSVAEAVASLRALAPTGIELCEQPVGGLDELADLISCTPVRLSIDESVTSPGALDRRHCEAVCLKVAAAGGITGLLDAARQARAVGYSIYLASSLEGPLTIAAALHAAAVIRPDRPSGLSTLDLYAAENPLPARDGAMTAPPGAGLGDGLRGWYR